MLGRAGSGRILFIDTDALFESSMKVEMKSFQTVKVKANKSDKRFQSYRHLKIEFGMFDMVCHAARETQISCPYGNFKTILDCQVTND